MFNTYSSQNLVIQNDLAVRYTVKKLKYQKTDAHGETVEVDRWDVTRVATMQYAFVGMDRGTANSCAAAKVAQFTRQYWVVDGDMSTLVPACMADVSVRHTAGHMYQVDVTINEQETRRVNFSPTNPALLFPARNYDASIGGGGIEITGVEVTDTKVILSYTQDIDGFRPSGLFAEYREATSIGEWAAAGNGASFSIPSGYEPGKFVARLMYGQIESGAVSI